MADFINAIIAILCRLKDFLVWKQDEMQQQRQPPLCLWIERHMTEVMFKFVSNNNNSNDSNNSKDNNSSDQSFWT